MSQHDDDDEEGLPHAEKKGETWLMTFADMMSLLMSFFVLLLSFSEQDVAKFKQVGGSLEKAFGVQTDVPANDPVKGTSLVSDRFSAGTPDPTDQNEVRQKTSVDIAKNLQVNKRLKDDKNTTYDPEKFKYIPSHGNSYVGEDKQGKDKFEKEKAKAKELVEEFSKVLSSEIAQHKIEIDRKKNSVTIRILEKAYFNSGDDSLKSAFVPLLGKLAPLLDKFPGKIMVSGHTDNVPIKNARFRSNWDLSAARAATTVHFLNEIAHVDSNKMVITGFADTKPIADNQLDEGRNRNRRVEITLLQGTNPLFDDSDYDKNHHTDNSTHSKVQHPLPQRMHEIKSNMQPEQDLDKESSQEGDPEPESDPDSSSEKKGPTPKPEIQRGLWGVPYTSNVPSSAGTPLKEEGPVLR